MVTASTNRLTIIAALFVAVIVAALVWLSRTPTQLDENDEPLVLDAPLAPIQAPGESTDTIAEPKIVDSSSTPDSDVCADTVVDSVAAGTVYPWEDNPPDYPAVIQTLTISQDADHKLALLLLTFGNLYDEQRMEIFDAALSANSKDPTTLRLIYAKCDDEVLADWCMSNEIEKRLLAADSSNGQTWELVAGRRFKNNRTWHALVALEQALVAPRIDSEYAKHVATIERGLAAAGAGGPGYRLNQAVGLAAAWRIPMAGLMEPCRVLSPTRPRWASLCLDYGRRLESDGQSEIDVALGAALQSRAFEAMGDEQAVDEIKARRAKRRARFKDHSDRVFQEVFYKDDAMVGKFLQALTSHDEFAAHEVYVELRDQWLEDRCSPGS